MLELKQAGFKADEIYSSGFTARGLKEGGFTATQCKAGGIPAAELKAAGFTASELLASGFSAAVLTAIGMSLQEKQEERAENLDSLAALPDFVGSDLGARSSVDNAVASGGSADSAADMERISALLPPSPGP